MRHLLSLPLVCGALVLLSAAPPPDKTIQKLHGAWRLVRIEGSDPILKPVYDHPSGLIVYAPSGWMIVQIALNSSRKPFAAGPGAGTPAEKAAAFDSYVAYYGTYSMDEKAGTVTHHLEDASTPGRHGHDNVRYFEFQGNDRLVLMPLEDGKGGVVARKDATWKLTWERTQ
jgi:hypothetical protein